MMSTADRGFASMDRAKQREIASKGGKAAHKAGTAHEWTKEEAAVAGKKGGMATRNKYAYQGERDGESKGSSDAGRDTEPVA